MAYYLSSNTAYSSLVEIATTYSTEIEIQQYKVTLEQRFANLLHFTQSHPTESLTYAAYDNALFLNNAQLFNAVTREKGIAQADSSTRAIHTEWKSCRFQLGRLYSQPIAERDSGLIATLEEQANDYEKELVRRSPEFAEAQKEVYWQDVKSQLHPNEAAIEVVNYSWQDRKTKADTTMYAVLVLTPGSTAPKFIPLCQEADLLAVLDQPKGYKQGYFDRGKHGDAEQERLADVQGIFNAYLAGYCMTAILPKVIAKLYESYQLKSKLDGYPALTERQQTSTEVLATVDTLTQLYETANFLTALGQYELAAASYQYILRYYPGQEVYNNLGACHALHALFCSAKSPDAFQYPLEIDTDSHLSRPRARGGESELTDSERALRKQLLLEAEKALKTAGKLDPSYFPVDVNLLCVLALQGKSSEAVRHWETHRIAANTKVSASQKNRARLALGIALAQTGEAEEREQASRIFQDIANQKADLALASIAAYNLKALQNGLDEKPAAAPAFDCVKPFELEKVDGVSIHRFAAMDGTALLGTSGLSFSMKKLPSSTVVQFQRSGSPVLNFQRVVAKRKTATPSLKGKRPQVVQTATGFFLICGEEHAAFLFSNDKNLTGWGRFYVFENN